MYQRLYRSTPCERAIVRSLPVLTLSIEPLGVPSAVLTVSSSDLLIAAIVVVLWKGDRPYLDFPTLRTLRRYFPHTLSDILY